MNIKNKNNKLIISIISLILIVSIIAGIIIYFFVFNNDSKNETPLKVEIQEFTLVSDKDYILVGKDYRITFSIKNAKSNTEDIYLYNGKKQVDKFYDNGEKGDLKEGDGVYSVKISIKEDKVKTLKFFAKTKGKKSNVLSIPVKTGYTKTELEQQDKVDKALQKIVNDDNFYDLSIEERKSEIDQAFADLIEKGYVKENNVFYTEDTQSYGFKYSNGDLGSQNIGDKQDNKRFYTGGSALGENSVFKQNISLEQVTNAQALSNKKQSFPKKALILFDYCERNGTSQDLGFDGWFSYFKKARKDWTESGLPTTVEVAPTVEYCKTGMKNAGLIMIAAHGNRTQYGWFEKEKSSICLSEKVTDENSNKYAYDRSKNLIVRNANGSTYDLLPNFFIEYYKDNGLENTVFLLGNCFAFGMPDDVDYTLSDKIKECGSYAVIGSVNTSILYTKGVEPSYSLLLFSETVNGLLKGEPIEQAFRDARMKYGFNFWEFTQKYYADFSKDTYKNHYSIIKSSNFDVCMEDTGVLVAIVEDETTQTTTQFTTQQTTTQVTTSQENTEQPSTIKKININKELSQYMGTDLFTFVNSMGDMYDVHASSAIEYTNDKIIVSSQYIDSEQIGFISIDAPCDYTLYGVSYGMSADEAVSILSEYGEVSEEWSSGQRFIFNDNIITYIHFSEKNTVDTISISYYE